MKKSDQSLNKALARGSIRRLFTVPMIICLVVFSLSFVTSVFINMDAYDIYDYPSSYSLIQLLREEARSMNKPYYEPCYCLSASMLSYSPLTFGAIFAALQFNFLLSKKSCYTQLSFAVDRRRLFTIKTLIPLLIPAAVILLTNIATFILNAVYIGITINLFAGVALSILTSLSYLLVGYTASMAGHLFTARRIEAYIFTISLLNIGSTIASMLAFILPETLYGYSDQFSYLAMGVEYASVDTSYTVDYFPVNGPTFFSGPIIFHAIALLVLGGILVLFKQYFVKKYRVEQSGIRGKSRIALVISCAVMSLSIVHSLSLVSSYLYYDEMTFTFTFIACIVASIILCLIICLLATFSPKKLLWGATAAGVSVVIHLVILAIGLTGGFGYDTRMPDKDKITSVTVSMPFEEMSFDYNSYQDNQFFWSYQMFPGNSIELTTEKDINIAMNIHKALINDREEETSGTVIISYYLKDGSTVERVYENISYSAANETFKLWETDKNQMKLRVFLNQATKEDEKKIKDSALSLNEDTIGDYTAMWGSSFEPDFYYFSDIPDPLPTFINICLFSKDSSVTCLDITSDEDISVNYTDEVALEIMGAIYKDAISLSADEWFAPEKNLGALAFNTNVSDPGIDADFNSYNTLFYINSNMTNTISVLEKYGYLKCFECTKEIEKAHVISVDDVCGWIQSYYDVYETPIKHGLYFSQMNSDIEEYLVSGCGYLSPLYASSDDFFGDEYYYVEDEFYDGYYDEFYDEIISEDYEFKLNPQEIHNKKEIKSLFNQAYLAHKVTGEGHKFLVIKYTDGSCSMLVIPNK